MNSITHAVIAKHLSTLSFFRKLSMVNIFLEKYEFASQVKREKSVVRL